METEPVTGWPAWRALQAHYENLRGVYLRDLFKHDGSTNALSRRYRRLRKG